MTNAFVLPRFRETKAADFRPRVFGHVAGSVSIPIAFFFVLLSCTSLWLPQDLVIVLLLIFLSTCLCCLRSALSFSFSVFLRLPFFLFSFFVSFFVFSFSLSLFYFFSFLFLSFLFFCFLFFCFFFCFLFPFSFSVSLLSLFSLFFHISFFCFYFPRRLVSSIGKYFRRILQNYFIVRTVLLRLIVRVRL